MKPPHTTCRLTPPEPLLAVVALTMPTRLLAVVALALPAPLLVVVSRTLLALTLFAMAAPDATAELELELELAAAAMAFTASSLNPERMFLRASMPWRIKPEDCLHLPDQRSRLPSFKKPGIRALRVPAA